MAKKISKHGIRNVSIELDREASREAAAYQRKRNGSKYHESKSRHQSMTQRIILAAEISSRLGGASAIGRSENTRHRQSMKLTSASANLPAAMQQS